MPPTNKSRRWKNQHPMKIFVKLFTDELFPLFVSQKMTIREVKSYLEFATGIPFDLQRLSYLDEGELTESSDIKSSVIIAGGTCRLTVWYLWKDLIKAAAAGKTELVLHLGVTKDSDFQSPTSNFMSTSKRNTWFAYRGITAMFVAIHRGHLQLVEALLEAGVGINAVTPFGRTVLHIAAAQGRLAILELLLKNDNGGNINVLDKDGNTAADVAFIFDHRECERLLLFQRTKGYQDTVKNSVLDSENFKNAPLKKKNEKNKDSMKNTRESADSMSMKSTKRDGALIKGKGNINSTKKEQLMQHQRVDSSHHNCITGEQSQVYMCYMTGSQGNLKRNKFQTSPRNINRNSKSSLSELQLDARRNTSVQPKVKRNYQTCGDLTKENLPEVDFKECTICMVEKPTEEEGHLRKYLKSLQFSSPALNYPKWLLESHLKTLNEVKKPSVNFKD